MLYTKGPIKTDLIKYDFNVVYHNHKLYSDITKFKLNGNSPTYLFH